MERYPNKRMMFRNGGRFSKAPTLKQMGFDVADGPMTCANCGHEWHPVLRSGSCPQCDSKEKL